MRPNNLRMRGGLFQPHGESVTGVFEFFEPVLLHEIKQPLDFVQINAFRPLTCIGLWSFFRHLKLEKLACCVGKVHATCGRH
jgi:hypothetical protein